MYCYACSPTSPTYRFWLAVPITTLIITALAIVCTIGLGFYSRRLRTSGSDKRPRAVKALIILTCLDLVIRIASYGVNLARVPYSFILTQVFGTVFSALANLTMIHTIFVFLEHTIMAGTQASTPQRGLAVVRPLLLFLVGGLELGSLVAGIVMLVRVMTRSPRDSYHEYRASALALLGIAWGLLGLQIITSGVYIALAARGRKAARTSGVEEKNAGMLLWGTSVAFAVRCVVVLALMISSRWYQYYEPLVARLVNAIGGDLMTVVIIWTLIRAGSTQTSTVKIVEQGAYEEQYEGQQGYGIELRNDF